MRDRTDDKLKRDLAEGPLKRGGFDDRLRRRIEERLDEEPGRRRSFALRFAGGAAGALAMALAVVLIVQLHPLYGQRGERAANNVAASEQAAEPEASALAAIEGPPAGSVLLLGLRQDREGEASAYRTLLVSAPAEPAEWSLEEGEGIVMPYRTDFWRVTTTEAKGADGAIRLLGAYNASRGSKGEPPSLAEGAVGADVGAVEEKALFVGNRYVAIARRTSGTGDRAASGTETLRVMDVADLAEPRDARAAAADAERHVVPALAEDGLLGVLASDEPGAEAAADWTIARKAGRWVARAAGAGGAEGGGTLQELPHGLSPSVVAHNELAAPWTAIRGVQPAAVDAFTSPSGNMAVVVTDRQLAFYALEGGELGRKAFETPLRAGETVIMAEWATNAAYVEMWVETVGRLLRE